MSDEEFVKSHHPQASVSDYPVGLYWPGRGTRQVYIITLAPILSRCYAASERSKDDAWQIAANRLRAELAKGPNE